MTTIAVLGTGLLGSGMVDNLLAKGHTVRIWNRTRSKLDPLVARGAVAADDPADCVRGCERAHLVLAEDDAVDAVITQLRPGLAEGIPVLDHTTNLPQRVAARFDSLRGAGVRYVPTPVFMAPKHAREGSGLMLMSGPQPDADELQPALAQMTGKLWHVGERPDLAAILKLAGNSVYFAITGAIADVLALGRNNGVDAETMMMVFREFKPGSGLHLVAQRIARAGSAPASFEMTMALKDARLMQASVGDEPLFVLPAVMAALQRGIEAGHGQDDFAGFAKG
ncbi:MAG TPA: NAD(P)-dependent oxidoreductase [bacterium]|nr:NAD(P)-dependent oxidoreductase [bacterium]